MNIEVLKTGLETYTNTELIEGANIIIIGTGPIGDKAKQLLEKTQRLKELGFQTPYRTILAKGYLDEIIQLNGLGNSIEDVQVTEITEDTIRKGKLTSQQLVILREISQSYGQSPLVIRSSAQRDARGTGIYESVFTGNSIDQVCEGLKQVLASYYTPDAIAYRQDAATGEGFGVIIESVIGQHIDDDCIAPILSGYGYSSTSRGEGYITIVPGLGCAVESSYGEQITRSQIEQCQRNLGEYILHEQEEMFYGLKPTRWSALLRTDRDMGMDDFSYNGIAFFLPSKNKPHAIVEETFLDYPEDVRRVLSNLDLTQLFNRMSQMEEIFNAPQYFEWAMTIEQSKPIFWIIQISNINKKLDIMDFGNFGTALFTGHSVIGTGIKESSIIVTCNNPDDISKLNSFNKNNTDYVLIFPSSLTSKRGGSNKLKYRNYSKAAVLLEVPDMPHIREPIAHLGGGLDEAGKFFCVLDSDENPNWELYRSREEKPGGLSVFKGRVTIVASERQNKMVVYLQEEPDKTT